ncbi:cysteine peptidase, Clan CA, family C2, putative [Leishmania donovani]|uniref:Cysteine peptidase, Clan CA, family C2, putative n=2 Tax=Leishmania donovani TaxID=5661 RepID=A0A3Q8IAR4_LEIDO|nr:cysteine peptidase, Clan CA, family C2, putative [Leishmania donovani]
MGTKQSPYTYPDTLTHTRTESEPFAAMPSNAELYIYYCRRSACHPNSAVKRYLDDTASSSLEVVDVSANYLGTRGLIPVLDLVKNTKTVHTLDLSNNMMELEHVEHLAYCLALHPCMRTVRLCNDGLHDGHVDALLQLLAENASIEHVSVEGNNLTAASVQAIARALEKSKAVRAQRRREEEEHDSYLKSHTPRARLSFQARLSDHISAAESGGYTHYATWWKNPQYSVKLSRSSRVSFVLECAHAEAANQVGMLLMRHDGVHRVVEILADTLVVESSIEDQRCAMEAHLRMDESYVVMPFSFNVGRAVDFTLVATLRNDHTAQEEGWITVERLNARYDWCMRTVEAAWTSDNAGGGPDCLSWRRNDMYHLTCANTAAAAGQQQQPSFMATVHVLLMKEADPYENDSRAIGLDVVTYDVHNATAPPLLCTPEVVRASHSHQRKTFISLQFSMPVAELDVFVVPSTAEARQTGTYSITVFSSVSVDFARSAFPHGWRYRTVTGYWDADCCGGCRQLYQSWKNNPATEVCVEDAAKSLVACVEVHAAEATTVAQSAEEKMATAAAEETPAAMERKAELEELRQRHRSSKREVCVAVVSCSPPSYAELAVSALSEKSAMAVASDIQQPVFVVPMLRHAAETGAYTLELFSSSSFVVCGATQSLAVRQRKAQLAAYSAENGRRAAQQNAEQQACRGGADLPALREERRAILDRLYATDLPFVDRDFPRGTSSLFLDPAGAPPLNFPAVTEWRRASQLKVSLHAREGDATFMSPPSPYGPRHWFASVLNSVAAKPGWLSRVFVDYFREAGFAQFAFYKQNEWVGVTVDDYLLVDNQGALVYGHGAAADDALFPLAEKAYAKLHRCYEAMELKVCPQQSLLELLRQGLMDVSGGYCSTMRVRPTDGSELPENEREAVWRQLKAGVSHSVLCALILDSRSAGARERSRAGLLPDRLYGVMDARFVEQQRVVKVRNVDSRNDADTTWRGKWAEKSSLWTETLLEVLQYRPDEDAMWMHFDEVLYYYTHLLVTEVCAHTATVSGSFAESTANDPDDADLSLRNPQYALTVTRTSATAADTAPIEVHVGVHRRDPRLDITRDKHATATLKTAIGFAVLATEDNCRRVCRITDKQLLQLVTPNRQRDAYCTLQLTAEALCSQRITVMPFREHTCDPDALYYISASCSGPATVSIAHVTPNAVTTVAGQWDSNVGAPDSPLWRNNPQFFLSPVEAMEVTITLRTAHPTSGVRGFTVHNTQRCSSFLTFELATVVASAAADAVGGVPTCVVRLAGMKERRGMPYVVVPYSSGGAEDFSVEVTANRSVQLRPIDPRLDWHRVRQNVSISAEKGNAGGSLAFPSWRFNTQMALTFPVEREGRLFISARRLRSADPRVKVGMVLMRSCRTVSGGYRRLLVYAEADIVARSSERAGGEATLATEVNLSAGQGALVLLVHADQPYKEAEVEVSVYSAATVEVQPVVEWTKVLWEEGSWELGTTAGGSRTHFANWINNPFYGLSVIRSTKVVVLLLQYPRDREHPKVRRYGQKKAFLPPPIEFKERCTAIELSIVKYDKDLSEVASVNAGTAAEAYLVTELLPDQPYLLVPCTSEPQHDGDFKLFVFADHPIDLFEAEKPRLPYV